MAKAKTKAPANKPAKPRAPIANRGAQEAAAFVREHGLSTAGKTRWYIEMTLATDDPPHPEVYDGRKDTRLLLKVYPDEWALVFVHKGKTSHVRRDETDFVNGFDQHKLVDEMPALHALGAFVKTLEAKHKIAFNRPSVHVRSNLAGVKPKIAEWIAQL